MQEFLTPREKDVLLLIGEGLKTKEIAASLGVSEKAVEFQKTRLYAKIGVTNAVGATRYAIRQGYVDA